jgi:hypothetical protein
MRKASGSRFIVQADEQGREAKTGVARIKKGLRYDSATTV